MAYLIDTVTRKSDYHANQASRQVRMPEQWLQVANWAQMLGAALVAAGAIASYYLSKDVIAEREQRIASAEAQSAEAVEAAETAKLERAGLELRVASANERAEKAGADAAQARLELARLKAPRTIPPEHQERFATALRKFPGQPYELAGAAQDREVRTFLTELDGMLTDFGWRRVPSQKGDYSMFISETLVGMPVVADVGVTVLVWQTGPEERNEEARPSVEQRMKAGVDLVNLLNQAGISSDFRIFDTTVKNRDSVRIEIGRKP